MKENQRYVIDEYEASKTRQQVLKSYENLIDFEGSRDNRDQAFKMSDMWDKEQLYKLNIGKLTKTHDHKEYSNMGRKVSNSSPI